jgi:hypothetical protein
MMQIMDSWADQGEKPTRVVKSFAPSLLKGRLGVGPTDVQARHPIPVTLLVSRCASVPIPLDSSHSASTLKNIKNHIHQDEKGKREKGDGRRKTYKVFLTGVKLLSISIQPELLFAAHL